MCVLEDCSQLLTFIGNRRRNANWLGRRARTQAYAHITYVQNAPIKDIWDFKAYSAAFTVICNIITVSTVELVYRC